MRNVEDVFTPGEFPEHTYVERSDGEKENRIKYQLRREGALITLSGPSKSGKSVMVERVVGTDDLAQVYGGDINSVEGLWNQVLDELGAPDTTESISTWTQESQKTGSAGIRSHIFTLSGEKSTTEGESKESAKSYTRRGLNDVIEVNEQEEFILLIDDFHEIQEDVRSDVGASIKQAVERGLSVCIALIPYRSDDLTRATPDLRGRSLKIELEYWDKPNLKMIGEKGFNELNVDVDDKVMEAIAEEAVMSPHLMQQLCYDLCGEKGIINEESNKGSINIKEREIKEVLRRRGESIDLDKQFDILNGEGISGGKERSTHRFTDETTGDVYESILRAIGMKPTKVSIDRSELMNRIDTLCDSDGPRTASVTQALDKMDERITNNFPSENIFEWLEETNDIETPDPYLIFYIRWSDKIGFEPDTTWGL